MDKTRQLLKSKGLTDQSINTYYSILVNAKKHLGERFTEQEAEEYLTSKNLSPRSYNLYMAVLNFHTVRELGFRLKFRKAKTDKFMPTFVTKEELTRVLLTIPNLKHKLWYALMYRSGLRVGEVSRLKKHDIYFDNLTVKVRGKGRKDRLTILHPKTARVLEHFIKQTKEDNPFVFQSGNHHISTRSIQERLKTAIIDSKITKKFKCHDLRHSFAVNFLNDTDDLETLRKLLGHSKLSTTQEYLKCRTTDLTKLAKRLYCKDI